MEYYGWALIAGIREEDARRMVPGRIVDFFNIRARYDASMASAGIRL